MATIVKKVLSGSTDGFPILLSGTAGTVIHTGSTSTSVIDEAFVWVANSSTAAVTINVEYGASGSQVINFEIPAKGDGLYQILPGLIMQGRSASGPVLSINASSSGVIQVHGFVNRITQT